MRVFSRRYELMPRPELEQLQLERLQALVVRLTRNVRRYRERLEDMRLKSLEDLSQIPFTTPEDVAQSFPYGMFAVPLRQIVRLHSTMGPGGSRQVVGHTHNDLRQWGQLVARQLVAGGLTAKDVVLVCLAGDARRTRAGFALGAELVEASVIAEDPSHVDVAIALLHTYKPTTLITTPSNALELARALEVKKIDSQSLHLGTVLLTRPVERSVREELAARLQVELQANFGIAQIVDPGLCVECEAGHFHVYEDQFLVEEHDGELVVTTLCREALPLLRYRTRIACEIRREKCSCQRTGAILCPGKHLDGRLRIGETSLFEPQIAEVLGRSRAAGQSFTFEASERRLILSIEVTKDLMSDMMWQMVDWRREIEEEFLIHLGVEAEVRFVSHARS